MNRALVIMRASALILLTVGVASLYPAASSASVFKSGDDIHVSNLHVIEDDFYGLAEQVRVDGTINGDLLTLGNSCTIQGTVMKSANLGARYVRHLGYVVGSLRAVGETVTIGGKVDGSVVAAGREVRIEEGAVIERDANLYGEEVSVNGMIIGHTHVTANRVYVTGTIQGDVTISADKISISPPAVINGNLTYESEQEANIAADDVTILGEVTWEQPEIEKSVSDRSGLLTEAALRTSSLLAAFLFGIIVIRLFRPYAEESFEQLRGRMSVSLAAGFLGVLIIAGCVVVLFISLIALLVGEILISSDEALVGALILIVPVLLLPITSFVSISGGIILYSGKILMAYLVGHGLIGLGREKATSMSAWSLLLGLAVLTILCAVPYLGFLLFLAVVLAGGGAILLGIRNCRRKVAEQETDGASPGIAYPPAGPAQSQ